MFSFLSTPLGITIGIGVILALVVVFVFRDAFKLGSGTGGVTGKPREPLDPVGNMKPGGTRPSTPPKPPSEQV